MLSIHDLSRGRIGAAALVHHTPDGGNVQPPDVPVFTLQPAPARLNQGESVTLTAHADNATQYQWQKYVAVDQTWADMVVPAGPDLTLTNVTAADSTQYRVIAVGSVSTATAISSPSMVKVDSAYVAIRKRNDPATAINTPPLQKLADGRQSLELKTGDSWSATASKYDVQSDAVISGGANALNIETSDALTVTAASEANAYNINISAKKAGTAKLTLTADSVGSTPDGRGEVVVTITDPNAGNNDVTVTKSQVPVTYSGTEGSGTAATTAQIANVTIALSPVMGLYNGDKVYATITPAAGYTVNGKSVETFEYTVAGLTTFVPAALKWVAAPPAEAIIGDSISASWSGGTAPYVAKLTVGSTDTPISSDETTSGTVATTGKTQGAYKWTVTDAAGTALQGDITIRENIDLAAATLPVTFAGDNKSGTATIAAIPNATATLSKSTGLTNGEKITVTVTANAGYRINRKASAAFTVTVTGLDTKTVMSFDQNLPGDAVTVPVFDGEKQVLTVVVSGGVTPYAYQWRKNGSNITGATSSSYTIAAMTAADAATYTCVVTDAATPANTLTSNDAVVTYMPYSGYVGFHTLRSGSSAPTVPDKADPWVWNGEGDQELNIAIGDAAFSLVARKYRSGTTTVYPGSGIDRSFTGDNPSIATVARNSATSSYQLVITPVAIGSFPLVVTENDGTATGTLKINITPNAAPTITQQPKDFSVKEGATVTNVCKGTSKYGTVSYKWFWRDKGDDVSVSNALVNATNGPWGTVTGALTNTMKIATITPDAANNVYWCVVTDARGSTKSEEVNIDVLANQYYIGFKRANQTGGTPGQTAPWGWIAEGEQTLTLAATAANYSAWLGRYFKGSLTSGTTLGDWTFTNSDPDVVAVTKPAANTLTFDPMKPGTSTVLVTTTDGRAVGKVTVTIT